MGRLPTQTGIRGIAIDPEQPMRVYATDESRVYRSDDAGRSWQLASQGLPEEPLAALALDPQTRQRLYSLTTNGALYTSENGADSWQLEAAPGAGHGT